MKDVFTRYTNDVIASTAFGLKINSLEEKNNQFYEMGKKATDFSGVQFLKFLGYGSMPRVMKVINSNIINSRVRDFVILTISLIVFQNKIIFFTSGFFF